MLDMSYLKDLEAVISHRETSQPITDQPNYLIQCKPILI